MKTTVSILLFSGRPQPEQEISDELSKELQEAVSKLLVPSPKPFRSHLGFSGFLVRWSNGDGGIYIQNGVVKIHNQQYPTFENGSGCFVDDQGIENKVRENIKDLILQWLP